MFAIRPATAADLDAILQLAASIPEAPRWSRSTYEGFLGNPARALLVAPASGSLAGFVAGTLVTDFCDLESIAVAPSARRFGNGTALLSALVEWARSCSAIRVQLEVRAGNGSAIFFYQRAGFHSDGRRPRYYQNPDEDALLMSLPLRSEPKF